MCLSVYMCVHVMSVCVREEIDVPKFILIFLLKVLLYIES